MFGYGVIENGTAGQRREALIPFDGHVCAGREWRASGCTPFVEFVLSAQGSNLAGVRPTRDSCSGDSGGPVFWESDGRRDGPRFVVGVVSRATSLQTYVNSQPCGGGGIYSTVGRHTVIGWLRKEMRREHERRLEREKPLPPADPEREKSLSQEEQEQEKTLRENEAEARRFKDICVLGEACSDPPPTETEAPETLPVPTEPAAEPQPAAVTQPRTILNAPAAAPPALPPVIRGRPPN